MENRKQIARCIQKLLDEFVPNPQVPLIHTTPFQLLVATLLSAQCTDERVNLVTPKLFQLCPTPREMANIPLKKLVDIISSCGLFNRKAQALHELSIILVRQFDGQVPASFTDLESLPGVGHKTASCVMAHAFSTPAFPVDTHIFRVAKRWGLSNGKSVEAVEKNLKQLFPRNSWSRLHLQMILYARRFCPAKKHSATACPICSTLTFQGAQVERP